MIKDISLAIVMFLGGVALLCLPFALWIGVMAAIAWLIGILYSAGLQPIISGPDILFWQMFCLIWLIAIIGNLIRR